MFRKKHVLSVLVGLALAIVSAAAAAWMISGSGTGRVTAKNAQDLTISEPTPAASLYPGATVALTATITNPNPFPVHVNSLDLGSITSGDAEGCPATNVAVEHASYSGDSTAGSGGDGWDIAANSTTDVSLAGAVSMADDADNGCQGVTFSVPLTAAGVSSAG